MRIQQALLLIGLISAASVSAFTVTGFREVSEPIPTSTCFSQIALMYNGEVYGKVDSYDDSIWFHSEDGNWYQYINMAGFNIDAVNQANELILSKNSYYYKFSKGKVTSFSLLGLSTVVQIVEGPNNSTWACDSSSQIKKYNSTTNYFTAFNSLVTVSSCNFAIDKYNVPWVIVNSQLKRWDDSMNAWKVLQSIDNYNTLMTMRDGSIMMWTTNNTLQIYNHYFNQFEDVLNATALGFTSYSGKQRMFSFLSKTNFIIAGGLDKTKTSKNYYLIPSVSSTTAEEIAEEKKFFN